MNKRKYMVYIHTFPNGKKYVGITCRSSMARWGSDGNKYKGQIVYRAIQKYGWENVKHEIVFENLTKKDACLKEQELISKYHTFVGDKECNGYNNSLGGESGAYGTIRSEKTRQKMRDSFTPERRKMLSEKAKLQKPNITDNMREAVANANKNRIWKESSKRKASESRKKNQISQYDLEGNLVRKWKSAIDIEKETGWYATSIIKVCKGKGKTYYGYVWRYNDEPFDKFDYEQHIKRSVLQYDLLGNFIQKYESLTEASKIFNCEISCIGNCCRGLNVSSFDYLWFYEDEFNEEKLEIILESFKDVHGFKRFYWFIPIKNMIESGKTRQEVAKELNLQWQFVNKVSKMKYLDYSISA